MTVGFLISYAFFRRTDVGAVLARARDWLAARGHTLAVFADSGAFSVATQGDTVDLDDYAAWLGQWGEWFDIVCTLDVIGDADATARNTARLADLGFPTMPVFHAGEAWSYLDDAMAQARDTSRGLVGLGGMVPWSASTARLRRWLLSCWSVAQPRGVRFHALGLTSWRLLPLIPLYSADSSTWAAYKRFGYLALWDPRTGQIAQISIGQEDHRALVPRQGRLLRHYGLDPAMVCRRDVARRATGKSDALALEERGIFEAATVASQLNLQLALQRRHGTVGLPGYPPGPVMFLALVSSDDPASILASLTGVPELTQEST
ncbi:MAG: hypothetical protein LC798_07485 [Chloroflexi bacterium]|nr:hypothetical protein [Chloroflexota bacterium]